jgi:hypothetical protein
MECPVCRVVIDPADSEHIGRCGKPRGSLSSPVAVKNPRESNSHMKRPRDPHPNTTMDETNTSVDAWMAEVDHGGGRVAAMRRAEIGQLDTSMNTSSTSVDAWIEEVESGSMDGRGGSLPGGLPSPQKRARQMQERAVDALAAAPDGLANTAGANAKLKRIQDLARHIRSELQANCQFLGDTQESQVPRHPAC